MLVLHLMPALRPAFLSAHSQQTSSVVKAGGPAHDVEAQSFLRLQASRGFRLIDLCYPELTSR